MGEQIRTYRDLVVWQKAMALVTRVYEWSRSLPKEELYGLTSQLRRAAVSVPSNVAEGYARNSTSDYIRFLRVASGSLYELQTQMEIALNLGYVSKTVLKDFVIDGDEVARMLSALIRRLENSKQEHARANTKGQ
jgi:four helix bundle protein